MGVIRYKIWSEIWQNKGRTLQIVLIIAMGAFALGMIMGARNLFQARVSEVWQTTSPATISLAVSPAVDETMITSLKGIKGVEQAEGFSQTTLEWRLHPGDAWQSGALIARDDYTQQHYNQLQLVSGQWPSGKAFAFAKGDDTVFGFQEGGQVDIRLNDREYTVQLSGAVADLIALPPGLGGSAQFYSTLERLGDLTGSRDFNRILAGAPRYDEPTITTIADRMQRRLEKQGIEVMGAAPPVDQPRRVADPAVNYLQATLDSLFFILGVMAVLALLLGLLLVYNTINALVNQQVNQIGMMKAVGARSGQILLIYLVNILIYGLLAFIVAAPLGAWGAFGLYTFFIEIFFNISPGPFHISLLAILAQLAIALIAPLLASLGPIWTAMRITVREAISTYGLTAGAGLLERWLVRLQRIPRLVVLTFSNTFRNKWRVLLTQATLVGSGVIFMMVVSTQESATYTFSEVLFSILRFNVAFKFEQPERIEQLEALTLAQPGVKAVELWGLSSPKMWLANQPKSNENRTVQLFGIPLPTQLYGPHIQAGRWLQADDTYAVVLNQRLAKHIGIKVGDRVIFDHGPYGKSEWQVVGLFLDPALVRSAYVPRDTLLREIRSFNRASTIWIQTTRTDAAGEVAIAQALQQYYEQRKFKLDTQGVFFGQNTASQIVDLVLNNFRVIIFLFGAMAIIIGLVGSVALSGILSLSVLERRREIGVMRAIGASSISIAGMFIGEGILLGWLSWLIAAVVSIPASYGFTQAFAEIADNDIVFKYTPTGALYWLVIVTILAIIASWFPAHRATQMSVRESLAYL
ncbi:MAG: ABC transporter permease [Anaerolineae bacterium]